MDTSGSATPHSLSDSARDPRRTTGLYPDLSLSSSMNYEEEDDVLVTLGVPPANPKSRPVRPPPPRNNSCPPKRSNTASLVGLTKVYYCVFSHLHNNTL